MTQLKNMQSYKCLRQRSEQDCMKFDLKDCGGCKTCKLACSYRFTGGFSFDSSAIDIIEKTDGPGRYVILNGKNSGFRYICDGCKDLTGPMCIQYCHLRDELKECIKEFLLFEDKGVGKYA